MGAIFNQLLQGDPSMKANVGGIDKILRIAAGLGLIGLAIAGVGTPWSWIGVVPLATGVVGFCPVYPLLGLNTCPAR
jgi:hypothetical protein